MKHLLPVTALIALLGAPLSADVSIGTITKVASGLSGAWSVGFLPLGDMIVTVKTGKLYRISSNGQKQQIKGLPQIRAGGQGGLLDVLVDRDFAQNGRIYLSFVKPQGRGEGTAVLRARLEGNALSEQMHLFEMGAGSSGGRHFGGRLAQDRSGALFLTIGDRGDRPSAQDTGRDNGKIIRITPETGAHATWTSGHRNPQGLAFAPNGQLWAHEHGARGGDEINRISKGKNYGWPIIAYGRHYSGGKIGEGTAKAGMEQPTHYWDPSIAPSGFAIHSGNGWPEIKGKMLVGSLKFDYIAVMNAGGTQEVGQIKSRETQRVRDVREGPMGGIWFLSEGNGALYRIAPPD